MRCAAIDDHSGPRSGLNGLNAGFHLGDHAAGNHAIRNGLPGLLGSQFRDQLAVLVQHAGTSVSISRRVACTAPATAPAAVSALML